MTFIKSAWAIDGPQIPSALARRALFAASAGQDGIIRPADLKVTATTPASASVTIAAGSAVVLNRSGGGSGQSYAVNNEGDEDVETTATGGGGRSDLVIVRVRDPEFSPWPPPEPGEEDDYVYVESFVIANVPSDTTNFAQLGLGYSAYALARIDRPGGTAMVTNGNIVDLRKIANPRISVQGDNVTCAGSDLLNATPPMTWENFPDSAHFPVDIPSWASSCLVTGFVEGLGSPSAGLGGLRLLLGGEVGTSVTNIETIAAVNRVGFPIGGKISIPTDMRGHTRNIQLQGRIANSGSAGMLQCLDGQTGFQAQVTFLDSTE